MRSFTLLLFSLLICFSAFCQEENIKKLELQLSHAKNQKEKFERAAELCHEWLKIDAEKAKELSVKYFNEAVRLKDNYWIAKFSNQIGSENLYLGDYPASKLAYEHAYKIALQVGDHDLIGRVSGNMGTYFDYTEDIDSAQFYYRISLKHFIVVRDTANIADDYNSMGISFYYFEEFDSSNYYLERARNLFNSVHKREGYADATFNIGNNFYALGNVSKSMEYLNEADRIYDSLKLESKLAETKFNMGQLYFEMENYPRALELCHHSLAIKKRRKDALSIAKLEFTIANIHNDSKNYDSARIYYNLALDDFTRLGNTTGIAGTTASMGIMELDRENYSLAIELFKRALKIHEEEHHEEGVANQYLNLAHAYHRIGQEALAYQYAKDALMHFKKINYLINIPELLKLLSEIAEKNSDFKNGFYYLQEYVSINDSLNKLESKKLLAEMETQYNTREKETKNKLLQQESKLKDVALQAAAEQEARKNILLYFSFGVIVIIAVFLFYVYKANMARKKANQLLAQRNEQIIRQNDSIRLQKEIIEDKQKEITDSINYAKRIQRSLLASDSLLNEALEEHFVLFKPKDIVSGDFYWALQTQNQFFLMCADCTGHGVPGAFMSLLGVSFLNEITKENKIQRPDEVLNRLRDKIISTLNQESGIMFPKIKTGN